MVVAGHGQRSLLASASCLLSGGGSDCAGGLNGTNGTADHGDGHASALLPQLLLLFVLLASMLIELGTHALEEKLVKHGRMRLTAILRRLYKELMIVGVVAVAIMVISMNMEMDVHQKHTFEIIHIAVFGVMVLFLVAVLILMAFNERTSEAWHNWEAGMTPAQFREMSAEVRDHNNSQSSLFALN